MTENFPKKEIYSLSSQIRRAAVSITANIAEGFLRFHFKDKTRFYYQARASTAEVQNYLLLAKDLGYINLEICGRIGGEGNQVIRLINGLIRSIEKQKVNI